MSVITKALYKRKHPERFPNEPLTRKELKALAQHDAEPNKKTGWEGSYKAKSGKYRQAVAVQPNQVTGGCHYLYDDGTVEYFNA